MRYLFFLISFFLTLIVYSETTTLNCKHVPTDKTQKEITKYKKEEKDAKTSLQSVEQTIEFKQKELQDLEAKIKQKREEFTKLNNNKGKDN